MIIDEARKAVGKRVVYTAGHGAQEYGEVTSVREPWVFVRYDGDLGSKATSPKMLALAEVSA